MAWRRGQSGNPGGRPRLTDEEREARALAKSASPRAVRRLVQLMDEGESDRVRLSAAKELIALTSVGVSDFDPLPDSWDDISAFRRRLTVPDGTTKERELERGDVIWLPAQTHIGENIGTTDTEVLLVEQKGL